jgi:hypothetical protein
MDLNLINTSWCYHSIKSMGLIWERNWQWGRAVCTNFEFYCVICLRSTANRLLHLFEIFDLYQPCNKSLEKCTFRCHRLHCAYCANRYSLGADCVGDHIVYFVDHAGCLWIPAVDSLSTQFFCYAGHFLSLAWVEWNDNRLMADIWP